MKFIDLFAGLGGFHIALSKLKCECVFASEINENLRNLYYQNFGLKPYGDIKKIEVNQIEPHNILCAGFPCQPFSHAGSQEGLDDKERGNFLNDIARILKYHEPEFFILENVPHIRKHDEERTWNSIHKILHDECKYNVLEEYLSPHEFGVPQIRKRLFIVGSKKKLDYFKWPSPLNTTTDVKSILDDNEGQYKKLSKKQLQCLDLWQEIIQSVPAKEKLPGFPIWSTEFGATYPFEEKATLEYNVRTLSRYLGSYGVALAELDRTKVIENLPAYATNMIGKFPPWKINYIKNNREFYSKNRVLLEPFISRLKKFPFSWQKFEWNCGDSERDIYKYIIQFRASGVRIKKTNFTPALVLTSTQIPIIGWEKRYLTVKEAAKLQSLENIELPKVEAQAFRALGNAVNSHLVYLIASNLFDGSIEREKPTLSNLKKSA